MKLCYNVILFVIFHCQLLHLNDANQYIQFFDSSEGSAEIDNTTAIEIETSTMQQLSKTTGMTDITMQQTTPIFDKTTGKISNTAVTATALQISDTSSASLPLTAKITTRYVTTPGDQTSETVNSPTIKGLTSQISDVTTELQKTTKLLDESTTVFDVPSFSDTSQVSDQTTVSIKTTSVQETIETTMDIITTTKETTSQIIDTTVRLKETSQAPNITTIATVATTVTEQMDTTTGLEETTLTLDITTRTDTPGIMETTHPSYQSSTNLETTSTTDVNPSKYLLY